MKSKSLNFKWFSFIVIATLLFSSCEKEDNHNQENTSELMNIEQLSLVEKNEMIENYALILATSMGDNELRSTIKEEAQLMFDGDYDILSNKLENRVLTKKSIQVKELLSTSHSQTALKSSNLKSGNISGEEFLERIKKAFPNLQVSVPIHCDEWDTENYIPLVVFLPYDFDETKTKSVTAYDINGKKHKLSLDVEPTEPVIVVGISERIDENGERIGTESEYMEIIPNTSNSNSMLKSAPSGPASLTISHGPAQTIILQWADVENETGYEVWRMHQPSETQFWKFATTGQNDNGYVNSWIAVGAKVFYKVRAINNDGPSSWSPIMATTVSPRNDGEWLKIKRMRFSTSALKAVESWVSGAPELRLRVVKGSENGASTVFTSGRMEPNKRKDIENTWWNKEVQIFTWHTNTYGTVLTFDWQEEDNISKLEFTVNASYEAKALGGDIKAGGSVKFTADKNGSIGNTSVMWWHNRDQEYDLSGFKWQFVY